MSALVFLAIAAGLSILGCLILWLRHRQPSSVESGVDAFRREMDALAPPPEHGGVDRGRRRAR
jgi:hypothetical protein